MERRELEGTIPVAGMRWPWTASFSVVPPPSSTLRVGRERCFSC